MQLTTIRDFEPQLLHYPVFHRRRVGPFGPVAAQGLGRDGNWAMTARGGTARARCS